MKATEFWMDLIRFFESQKDQHIAKHAALVQQKSHEASKLSSIFMILLTVLLIGITISTTLLSASVSAYNSFISQGGEDMRVMATISDPNVTSRILPLTQTYINASSKSSLAIESIILGMKLLIGVVGFAFFVLLAIMLRTEYVLFREISVIGQKLYTVTRIIEELYILKMKQGNALGSKLRERLMNLRLPLDHYLGVVLCISKELESPKSKRK